MFRLGLFRVPAFSAGNLAGFLASVGRGGFMFMLIIWLQGIWLPYHGYSFESTPFWAAIYMLPMTAGFLIAGPLSGYLSDRYRRTPFCHRRHARRGDHLRAHELLPPNFNYAPFRSAPAGQRHRHGALRLSQHGRDHELGAARRAGRGIGNAGYFPERGNESLNRALLLDDDRRPELNSPHDSLSRAHVAGSPDAVGDRVAHLPPVGSLFAAFLGYNPMQSLLGPTLAQLPRAEAAFLTGKTFFPDLISGPFMHGMRITFFFSFVMMLVAAGASWLRGKRYVYGEDGEEA